LQESRRRLETNEFHVKILEAAYRAGKRMQLTRVIVERVQAVVIIVNNDLGCLTKRFSEV